MFLPLFVCSSECLFEKLTTDFDDSLEGGCMARIPSGQIWVVMDGSLFGYFSFSVLVGNLYQH